MRRALGGTKVTLLPSVPHTVLSRGEDAEVDVLTHFYATFRDVPAQLRTALEGVTETVYASFLVDGSLQTRNEVKRRTEICAKWALEFRKDLHWSIPRILDELPRALRCELDRIPYAPTREHSRTWGEANGRNLVWTPD